MVKVSMGHNGMDPSIGDQATPMPGRADRARFGHRQRTNLR
jgi:hypothetical protein